MKKETKIKLCALALITLLSVVVYAGRAAAYQQPSNQQPQQTGQPRQPAAPGAANAQAQAEPKNVQVLKGKTRQQIMLKMREIASQLGVQCNYCHVNPFETDTPRKQTARLMMRDYTMAMKHKDGRELTCNDCHRGQPTPLRTLAFAGILGKKIESGMKGMPREQVIQIMNGVSKWLGVDCSYCHTADFEEPTPRRQIAHYMYAEYTGKLVKNDGSAVNCNDCHQGHARPLSVLPFARRGAGQTPAETKKPGS
jgi:nitrate/TMAO reductase-like tetraheme cytochrome c subunit